MSKNHPESVRLQGHSQWEGMITGSICPKGIMLKCIFRMLLFLPSFGLKYFSASYGKKKKRINTEDGPPNKQAIEEMETDHAGRIGV